MDNSTQDNANRHFKISYDTYVVINAYMKAVEKRWQAPEHIHENAYDIIVTDIPENPMDALLRMLNES
tara:strand:- start:481 stop:684 length:204 start_codon:yes stop_codon:yes gene_type:complete